MFVNVFNLMIIHEEGLVEGPVCGSLPLNSEAAGLGIQWWFDTFQKFYIGATTVLYLHLIPVLLQ